jgi:UDPglucose 6-dehydrogenase
MKIGFAGLWHLGTVMSAVFAAAGHDVVAFDERETVERISAGKLPVNEPDLLDLISGEVAARRLRFSHDPSALGDRDIVWITYDTPVSDDGVADPGSVIDRVSELFPSFLDGALVCVSSQLPAGSTRELERAALAEVPAKRLRFACSPENLRLGKSIWYLRNIDRFVIGVRSDEDESALRSALAPLSHNVESMRVESAEMTKHALNAFLATSVAFINEVAGLCEQTGADAREVERGLKSDMRIGKAAYLRAGGAFAGGTLARDIGFIIGLEERYGLQPFLFAGVRDSNDYHSTWVQRRFEEISGEPTGKTIAILGLTYKPGTDTLRASNAIAFARWFASRGGRIRAFDPAVSRLPAELEAMIDLAPSAELALREADAALIGTEWPAFRDIAPESFGTLRTRNVFDPNRFLSERLENSDGLSYFSIGNSR